MKTGREVIAVAKQHGTDSLQFHIAVEEMALQRDMAVRALERALEALARARENGSISVPLAMLPRADMESALEFCRKH